MDSDTKHAELEIYDGEGSSRPSYGSLWNDKHFEQLLQAGPARIFDTKLSDVAADARVLVLGCGTGANVRTALDADSETVVGIELSATRLKNAAENTADPRATFVRTDAEQLPFTADTFDVVVSHSVLHHLPNWRTLALDEIQRVLVDDGQLLLYEPGRYNPPALVRRKFFPSNIHTPDEQPFDPGELNQVLDDYFHHVRLEGHCLVSNVIPVVANYLPVPIWVGPKLYNFERPLVRHGAGKFSWVITGTARGPRA